GVTGGSPYNHLDVINSDGTGMHEVYAGDVDVSQYGDLAISANGAVVMDRSGVNIHIANADGPANLRTIAPYGGGVRANLAADGRTVFFDVQTDGFTTYNGKGYFTIGDTKYVPGLYAVGVDGNGVRLVASESAIQGLFGGTPNIGFGRMIGISA